jgi:sugar lactone lactonase YvrE
VRTKKTFFMKTFFHFFGVTILLTAFSFSSNAQIITTIAGDSSAGYNGDNIPAITAELGQPDGIAVDGAGNVYIGDKNNNRIRKINTSGIITTIAGTGIYGYSGDDSLATNAKINYPYGVAVDGSGNVYFADEGNNCVRKINTSGIITTIAGNDTGGYNGDNIAATLAKLHFPCGVAVDTIGNIYITDGNNRIRKVNSSGIITTIGGTGALIDSGDNSQATAAGIFGPYAIALDADGNIYIGEENGFRVRKINTSGIITTVAGTGRGGFAGNNGPATAVEMGSIYGLAVDVTGNLFISDNYNNIVRKINTSGIITTYAGTGIFGFSGDGGSALDAEFNTPVGLAFDEGGNLFIVDGGNNRIRHITSTVSVKSITAIDDKLTVYPNPCQGQFMINLFGAIDEQAQVTITDIMGNTVKRLALLTNRPLNIKLDERAGLYFITVTTPEGTYNAKLVII